MLQIPCRLKEIKKESFGISICNSITSIRMNDMSCHSEWYLIDDWDSWKTQLLRSCLQLQWYQMLKLPYWLNLKWLTGKIKLKTKSMMNELFGSKVKDINKVTIPLKAHFYKTDYNSSELHNVNKIELDIEYNWFHSLQKNINQEASKTRWNI